MEQPSVKTTVRIVERNITITILAYRRLRKREIDLSVAELVRAKKKLKDNTNYEIRTIIGAGDPL